MKSRQRLKEYRGYVLGIMTEIGFVCVLFLLIFLLLWVASKVA